MGLFRRIRSICVGTLKLVIMLAVVIQPAFGQPAETESLVIIVRDSSGQPLSGIGLELYLSGPPPELYQRGLTEADGAARFLVYPADYLVSFVDDWRDIPFIPPSQQNGGTQTSGEMGGFGIHLQTRPDGSDHVLTFVVVRNEVGELVPLFDLSHDPDLLPEPFLMDGLLDEETTISGDSSFDLSPLIPVGNVQPTIVADIVQPLNPADTEQEIPMAEEHSVTSGSQSSWNSLLIIVIVAAVLAWLIGMAIMLAHRRRVLNQRRE